MYQQIGPALERRTPGEVVRIQPWGAHAVRVRAAADAIDHDLAWALDLPVETSPAAITVHDDGSAVLVNGRITVEADARGRMRFLRSADPGGPDPAESAGTAGPASRSARELLADKRPYTATPGPRVHASRGDGTYQLEQTFEAYDGERIFGLGQHLHGRFDQKGCVIDLVQGNTVAAIPFLYSSRGYGLLWNSPAVGRVGPAHSPSPSSPPRRLSRLYSVPPA